METRQNRMLDVLSKLMDEQDNSFSELKESYDNLYSVVREKLPKVLDEGEYTDNAGIVRQVNELLLDKKILTVVPELAVRNVIAIWGSAHAVAKLFEQLSTKRLGIELNSNLPLLMIPVEGYKDDKILAITYMDKLVPLSYDEYRYITKEVYKNNIDIRRLIRSFVIYFQGEGNKQIYTVLPEYVDRDNEYFDKIKKMVSYQIIITDEEGRWKKSIGRLLENDIYFLGNEDDFEYISSRRNNVILKREKDFKDICELLNVPCINFAIAIEFQRVLLDVFIFYCRKRKILKDKISKLAEDSINLQDSSVKKYVQNYREKYIRLQEKMEEKYRSFEKVVNEIEEASLEFESQNSNMLAHNLANDVIVKIYTDSLTRAFFKCVYAEKHETAKDIILKLAKANYPYTNALACLLKHEQGSELIASDIARIKECPDTVCEVAKIKLALAKDLGLLIAEKKNLVAHIDPLETGEEYYYYGKKLLDEERYVDASKFFLESLDMDYKKAGSELIKLAEKHPECKISIEELAENLVAEANYYVGKESIGEKYKKGVVNLKMAASMNHMAAIEMIADILFDKHRHISWQDMKMEANRHAVNNVIELYAFLDKKNPDEKNKLRMGLMFCKLNDYTRAYGLLKNIDMPEAQYECAKMCQYGNGLAKDLKMAKKHYERIKGTYKDSQTKYKKVCEMLENEKMKKEKTGYNENKSYASTSSYSSSSSSFCFITTAACMALHANKDCNQLNVLRAFRDEHIIGDGEDGDDLVKEYYRIGPIIVKHIDEEWNPFAIYNELWQEYILPSCKMIYEKRNADAKDIYISMVKGLCERYAVPVKRSIMEKYSIRVKKGKNKYIF